ncbi:hypothetical protein [Fundidesulfovibrio soli]|uniref:hypothetical protein n=1 Tax=Fundidesulfovibrio soli TaxID=2922716 RepID=UPI001FAEEAAF|nr:hypothetical protein [Fundidesulfovibrio soli]
MRSLDRGFLRYAGAMPAYDMFKMQRLAGHQDIPTENTAEMPDKIHTPMRTSDMSGVLETDLPDAVLERGRQAAAAGADAPDAVLERGRQAAAAGADNPDAILARGRQAAPERDGGRVISQEA